MISKLKHGSVIAMVASLLTAGSVFGQGISFSTVALTGDAAPGTGAGVVYSDFARGSSVLNGAGQTAFVAGLIGPGVDSTNDFGIWSEGGGSLGLVARDGDAAPGTGAGVVYSGFGGPLFNGAGQTAFFGGLTGPGVIFENNLGIWSEGGGSLGLVARDGDPAPDTAPGVVYGGVPGVASGLGGTNGEFGFNSAGQTAFYGELIGPGVDGTNDVGIWSEGSGSLGLVARTGDPAPGTGAGVVFASIRISR